MANTTIQLKYSDATSTPSSLAQGEAAYSNSSNKLFVGLSSGSIVAIGGSYYTGLVDAATNLNTASAIVKRDASGNFSAGTITAALSGNATTASAWQTARLIGVSGDATGQVSIDGSAAANVPLTLNTSGVTAATYGGSTQVPTFVVDAKGRITSAANVALSTTFNFAGNTGTGTTATGGTVTIVGTNGGGVTTTFTDATDTFGVAVDATVVRTSGGTISGDLAVTGNLTVSGTQTIVNSSTITTNDSLIKLANNNTVGDVLDIGFYGVANTGAASTYHGLVRQAAGNFFLFKGLTTDPSSNTLASGSLTAANTATLRANITGGTVSSLSSAIAVADGGTGNTSLTNGAILIGSGTGAITILANTGTAGTYANASHVPVITTDTYGRVSAVTNTAIAIDTSQITSGTLPITRGGTNQTTFTNGIVAFNGTALATLANTGTAGTYANAAYVPVITTDAYGRVSAVTNTAIAIDTSAITSGTLAVTRGGTGSASFTANGVIFGGLTSTSALLSVASATEGHVLQINTSGIPTFAMLNGGSF